MDGREVDFLRQEILDHLRRGGPAIHEIAEKDKLRRGRTAARIVFADGFDQRLQKIKAAMNVADRINACPFWNSGLRLGRAGSASEIS
jgi:hypothetical protein